MTFISRFLPHRRSEPAVHFHRGPQGAPTPCFETTCPSPRLSVDER